MALSYSQTVALTYIIKPGMKIASFGYPDIVAPPEMVDALMKGNSADLEYRKDSDKICKRHGLQQRPIPDADSLFELMGCKLDVYDIVKERGNEILCDLNVPMAQHETYDIVLDVGTSEHVFNIAEAIMNMAGIVRLNGYIIHENPFNNGNHGFYNLNPTWYHDFYDANGFRLLDCKLVTRDGRASTVPLTKRFRFLNEECNTFAIAKRIEVKEFVMPMQTKYAAAGLSGVSAAD